MAFLITLFVLIADGAQYDLIKNSPYPFDTSISINCQRGLDSCPIIISRFSKVIYFKCPTGPTICPVILYCDFLLEKEPKDSSSHLIQSAINDFCQSTTSFHNVNIQYVVETVGLNLFMKVVDIIDTISPNEYYANKTFHVQFDTTSFLSNTAIIPVGKNSRPQTQAGNFQNPKIQYFDIMGRILPANIVNRKKGSFTNRLILTNQKKVLFQ